MIAVDASLLVAWLSPEDRHHESADDFLAQWAGEDLVLHPLTLAEVLVGGVRLNRGPEMLSDMEQFGIRIAVPEDGEPLRLATLRATTGLKMPDCCVLDTAITHQADLATFDNALAAAARNAGLDVLT